MGHFLTNLNIIMILNLTFMDIKIQCYIQMRVNIIGLLIFLILNCQKINDNYSGLMILIHPFYIKKLFH